MIRFFRSIRQSLLAQGRISRYLTYAIGEIVLVVFGILIALNINLWNTERQERKLEVEILKEIRSNLDFDLREIGDDVALMDSISAGCTRVLAFLDSANAPTEAFGYDVHKLRITPHFDANRSGYELLMANGVGTIRNDSLRKAISALYETRYPYYARYEQERISFVAQNVEPLLLEHTYMINATDRPLMHSSVIAPEDFPGLKNDDRIPKMVFAIKVENDFVQLRARSLSSTLMKLAEQIDQELDDRAK
jgi:hypothetical protein